MIVQLTDSGQIMISLRVDVWACLHGQRDTNQHMVESEIQIPAQRHRSAALWRTLRCIAAGLWGLGRNFHLNIRHTLSPGTHSWKSRRFAGFPDSDSDWDSGRGATARLAVSAILGAMHHHHHHRPGPASKLELQHGNMLQSASSACIKYYATLCHRHRPDDTLGFIYTFFGLWPPVARNVAAY